MGKIKLQKIAGKPSKIVLEWNGHLEIFSRPQAIFVIFASPKR